MGKNAKRREGKRQRALDGKTVGDLKENGGVGQEDGSLKFQKNFIWQLQMGLGSTNGLDHCCYCDVKVPINLKCLKDHYMTSRHKNNEMIHHLQPIFDNYGMGWMEGDKKFYCEDCDVEISYKVKDLLQHIEKHGAITRLVPSVSEGDFDDVDSTKKVFKAKLWQVDLQSTNAGLNLQMMRFMKLGSPFILREDSPANPFIGCLRSDIFAKHDLSLITKVVCFLERNGTTVDRSEKIAGSNMKAFGMRRAMGDIGWYKHKNKNLYKLSEELVGFICDRLEGHYRTVFKHLRRIVEVESPHNNCVTIGNSPFTSFAVTRDYNCRPHVDQDDYDIGFIIWLQEGVAEEGEDISLFALPEFEVSFVSKHGDVFCFKAGGVYHCTRALKKKNQIGLAFFQKASLFRQVRRLSNLPVDGVLEDVITQKGTKVEKSIYEYRADFELRKTTYAKELTGGQFSLGHFE